MNLDKRWWSVIGLVVVALVAILGFRIWANRQLDQQILDYAKTALELQRFEEAETSAQQVLRRSPQLTEAALIASEAALMQGKQQDALHYLEPLLDDTTPHAVLAQAAAGNIHLELGHAALAEKYLRQALAADDTSVFVRRRLCYLLTLQGRRWESLPLRFQLLKRDQFTVDDLLFLGNAQALVNAPELQRCHAHDPQHPTTLLGLARLALRQNQLDEAERWLRQVIAAVPDQAEAQARLGRLLLDRAQDQALFDWHRQLPDAAETHPEIWVVRGLWAQRSGHNEAAVRCFGEAVRRDPNHQVANYQLSVALAAIGQPSAAAPFQQRADQLQALVTAIDRLFTDPKNLPAQRQAAELTEALGRWWESWGWYRAILIDFPDLPPAVAARDRLQQQLDDAPGIVADAVNPALQLDLSKYPLPSFDPPVTNVPLATSQVPLRFAEVAAQVGLEFQYFNGDDPLTEGRRMFEFTGGGVAILDFDGDGWPDIYLTQGSDWPPDPNQTRYRDRLFRNLGGRRFEDVTDAAGLGDNRFSQGVAVGDLDNDGWPDLLVANVGQNRLYRNNGDGTFVDITATAGIRGDQWTTSCLLADINGDAITDLYEVNYLQGGNVFDLICNRGGRARSCSPTEFDASLDRLFLGRGDGSFEDAGQAAGITAPLGKGLGLVAADFDGSGKLSLFVANDTTANHFYINTAAWGQPPRFVEQAIVRGLAFDRDGKAQACMGIAVDDASGDHRLDLFVTNFYKESNAYYVQQAGGFFVDQARPADLSESSFSLLGFGTQFLDADWDTQPDLVISNGHVDDFTYQGAAYQMPAQLYRNLGNRFAEIPGHEVGAYFQRAVLGRGLAKFDWNRDGREDVVVSHLDAPVALLENRTQAEAHYLTLRLVGTAAARDAIGTRVEVQLGDQVLVRQLTAGDGYQSSNQRCLQIGLGGADKVDRLTVHWLGGASQQLSDLAAHRSWTIVQDRGIYADR